MVNGKSENAFPRELDRSFNADPRGLGHLGPLRELRLAERDELLGVAAHGLKLCGEDTLPDVGHPQHLDQFAVDAGDDLTSECVATIPTGAKSFTVS